jgi:peptide/nickel transport system ATP-binding protein
MSAMEIDRAEDGPSPELRPLAGEQPLLSVAELSVTYAAGGRSVPAVRNVSFDVRPGEVVALVGESGSGKSTIALAILRMLPSNAAISGGAIRFDSVDLARLSQRELNRYRGIAVGLIPQDPMVALNPLHRVGKQVAEPLIIHGLGRRKDAEQRAVELLGKVGLSDPPLRARQFPHELSGGMRQRVLIAGAVATAPRLIVADEPTTALDVTVQKRILDDIGVLTASLGISVLLITHDLAVAADRADRIVVLRHGSVVEQGAARAVLGSPREAYTRQLLASAPSLAAGRRRHLSASPRNAGNGGDLPGGDREASAALSLGAAGEPELLSLDAVGKDFPARDTTGGARIIRAVESVSFSLRPGQTVGLVGESGSGKSTIARLALGLIGPTTGTVSFRGSDITAMGRPERRNLHRLCQLIYQSPYASLNPRLTVEAIVAEPLYGFGLGDRAARRRRTLELLDQVGLPRMLAERRPAELSGGQRQRVAIARALAPEPILVVCDEPVSALDVSIQAQILGLLAELQARHHLSYLFISHDLAVVRQVADEVGVLKEGRLVEFGPADAIFDRPQHPYTRLLLDSVPGKRLATT